MSKRFLPMFSSKSFMVSWLTFRSLIHFEFTFVYGVRQWFSFILLHVADQFCQHQLLKRLSFAHYVSMAPLLCINWPYMLELISGLYSVPLVCGSVLVPVPNCLHYCGLKLGSEIPPAIFFLLRIALVIRGLWCFHMNFWTICSSSLKNVVGNLIGIASNLYIALGRMAIFDNINSS